MAFFGFWRCIPTSNLVDRLFLPNRRQPGRSRDAGQEDTQSGSEAPGVCVHGHGIDPGEGTTGIEHHVGAPQEQPGGLLGVRAQTSRV